IFLCMDALAMVTLAVIAVAPVACARLIGALFARAARVERRLLAILETMNEGLRGLRARSHLVPILVYSVGIWVVLGLTVWTGLRAAPLALPFSASWAVLVFLGIGVSLPSSPGFVGVAQAAIVLALALYDVPRTEAFSFSILLHASQYFPVTLCGLVLLLVEHVSLTEAARAARAPASADAGGSNPLDA